jgi:putative NIF3 family GTP cyclohydrolase 1 type 2
LKLRKVVPLIAEKLDAPTLLNSEADSIPNSKAESLGTGRAGDLERECTLAELAQIICEEIPYCRPRVVDAGHSIVRVGIVCGSGGSLVDAAVLSECDLFLTGEATFHQCLEAKGAGLSMLMIGHFASEKFAMDSLAAFCKAEFAILDVWGSVNERDPVSSI